MKKDITELFCFIDDFSCGIKEKLSHHMLEFEGCKGVTRKPGLKESELITIALMFHQSPCKNFKYFYKSYLQLYKGEFPLLPSYERFIALMPRVTYLLLILLICLFKKSSKIGYIDSTSIAVL